MRAAWIAGTGVVAVLLLVGAFNLFQPPARHLAQYMPYSDLLAEVAAGHMREAVITGRLLQGITTDQRVTQVYLPDEPGLARELAGKGVRVTILAEDVGGDLWIKLAGWGVYWIVVLANLVYVRKIAVNLGAVESALRRQMEGTRP